jgi:hypothetical protein
MKYQRQSEIPKKGEGKAHKQGVQNVIDFINAHSKADVYRGWWVKYNPLFVQREKITWTPEHEYDIAIQNKRTLKYLYIEVDGSSHDSKQRQIKDGIAEKHANETGVQVIRLSLTECLGDPEERELYLMRILWKFIK